MAAGLGADPAMIVGFAVRFAFVCAELAGDNARVKLGVHEFVGCFGLAREYPDGRGAHIRAVQIRPNAAPYLFEVFGFAEAGVRARRATIGTCSERSQGFGVLDYKSLIIGARVAAQHHFDGFHSMPLFKLRP